MSAISQSSSDQSQKFQQTDVLTIEKFQTDNNEQYQEGEIVESDRQYGQDVSSNLCQNGKMHHVNGQKQFEDKEVEEIKEKEETECQFPVEIEEESLLYRDSRYQREESHSNSSIQREQEEIEKDKIQIVYQCQSSEEQNEEYLRQRDSLTDDDRKDYEHPELKYSLKRDSEIQVGKIGKEIYTNEEKDTDPSYKLSEGIQIMRVEQDREMISRIQEEETVTEICSNEQAQDENVIGLVRQDQKECEDQAYTIPYELLPNHLKGFTVSHISHSRIYIINI